MRLLYLTTELELYNILYKCELNIDKSWKDEAKHMSKYARDSCAINLHHIACTPFYPVALVYWSSEMPL